MNDPAATARVVAAFAKQFPAGQVREVKPAPASEDFGSFGTEWGAPSVFWFVGGTDPKLYAEAAAAGKLATIPTNHNPRFAPLIHPTLEMGITALVAAALAWVAR